MRCYKQAHTLYRDNIHKTNLIVQISFTISIKGLKQWVMILNKFGTEENRIW